MNRNHQTHDFDADLRAAFAQIRASKGKCPEPESLEQFASGTLTNEEQASIAQHVRMCGVCDDLVTRLQAFDAAVIAPRDNRSNHLLRIFLHPAFAYGTTAVLALILILPRPKPPVPKMPTVTVSPPVPVGAAEAAPAYDLSTTRSAPPVNVRSPGGGSLFTLRVGVPVRPGFVYSAQINGPARIAEFDLTGFDALGNATIVCRTDRFVAGHYTLKVIEKRSKRGPIEGNFSFAFDVR